MVGNTNSRNKKHAFLIGVYKNPDYLKHLILSLDSSLSNIYVHINRYNFNDFSEIIDFFKTSDNIFFYNDIKVKWGGRSLLDSISCLIEESLKNPENQYFHLITGQDILIRPLNELIDFFSYNEDKNYLAYEKLPKLEKSRYNKFHLYDIFNVRSCKFTLRCETAILKIQMLLGIKRKEICEDMYWGSGWWSLQRDTLEYSFEILKKKYMKRIRHTFAPDEMIFQTILLNAKNKFNIVNNNLRFMIWNGKAGPKILDENDYENIIKSKCFFARKIEPEKSNKLIKLIETYRNN